MSVSGEFQRAPSASSGARRSSARGTVPAPSAVTTAHLAGRQSVSKPHIRWFNLGGPDELDNGLALCSLHHKLLDRGALGLSDDARVQVSEHFRAVGVGKAVYDLHGRELRPRPGVQLPATQHVEWHRTQVFKGSPLAA